MAVLPGFAVRNEVRDGTLKKLVVKNIQLDETYLMLVEPARKYAKPGIEVVEPSLKSIWRTITENNN